MSGECRAQVTLVSARFKRTAKVSTQLREVVRRAPDVEIVYLLTYQKLRVALKDPCGHLSSPGI